VLLLLLLLLLLAAAGRCVLLVADGNRSSKCFASAFATY
jgi:hypothetical protein